MVPDGDGVGFPPGGGPSLPPDPPGGSSPGGGPGSGSSELSGSSGSLSLLSGSSGSLLSSSGSSGLLYVNHLLRSHRVKYKKRRIESRNSCTYLSSSSPGSSGSSPGGGGGGRAPGGGGGSCGTIEGFRPGVLPPVGIDALPSGGGIGGDSDGVCSGGLPDEIGIGIGSGTVSVLLLLETLDEEPEFAVDVVLVTLGTLVEDSCVRVADSEVDQTDVKVIV